MDTVDTVDTGFPKGLRVRTPKGEGRVLQSFAERVTVQVADRAFEFTPAEVEPLEQAPF